MQAMVFRLWRRKKSACFWILKIPVNYTLPARGVCINWCVPQTKWSEQRKTSLKASNNFLNVKI